MTYHFWKAITYVADPVDATYQSLIVSAPVEIDGETVDPTNAPILLANSIGGYLPSSVADATGVGAPSGNWDQGHGANTDPGDFITWMAKVTGHRARAGK